MTYTKLILALVMAFSVTKSANAFLIFFPIPNLAKPPALQKIIDALEKSNDTKAVAFISEDKTFGSKQWAWGQASGVMTQDEANAKAMKGCEDGLLKLKQQTAGGQPIYDFGAKKCELHKFTNETVNLPYKEPTPAVVQNLENTEGSTAKKLKELDSLLQQNLISKEEYDSKRKEIINKL